MTVITVSGLADGSMWPKGRAGRRRACGQGGAGRQKFILFILLPTCHFREPSRRRGAVVRWLREYLFLGREGYHFHHGPWEVFIKTCFWNEMLVVSCPSQREDSWAGRATNRRDSTRLTWASTTLCRARSFTPTTSCNPHHSPMSRHSYPHFLLVFRTKKRCLSVWIFPNQLANAFALNSPVPHHCLVPARSPNQTNNWSMNAWHIREPLGPSSRSWSVPEPY